MPQESLTTLRAHTLCTLELMLRSNGYKKFQKTITDDLEALRTDLSEVRNELEITRTQLAVVNSSNEEVAKTVSLIDERVLQLSRELTNQIHELGNEIEQLEKQGDSASAETIAQLHATQIRLATEQARYEITFRQDLAELADQLRRPR